MGTNNKMGTDKCGYTNKRMNKRTKSSGYLIEISIKHYQDSAGEGGQCILYKKEILS